MIEWILNRTNVATKALGTGNSQLIGAKTTGRVASINGRTAQLKRIIALRRVEGIEKRININEIDWAIYTACCCISNNAVISRYTSKSTIWANSCGSIFRKNRVL